MRSLFSAIALLALSPSCAWSAPVTVRVAGVVSSIVDPYGVLPFSPSLGDDYILEYTYESTTTDVCTIGASAAAVGCYGSGLLNTRVVIGSYEIVFAPTLANSALFVFNDYEFASPRLRDAYSVDMTSSLDGADSYYRATFDMRVETLAQPLALASDALVPPSLNDFMNVPAPVFDRSAQQFFHYQVTSGDWPFGLVYGSVDSVNVVPLPPAAFLLASVLLSFLGIGTRARPTLSAHGARAAQGHGTCGRTPSVRA